MPIIAESPPMTFGGTATPTPTPAPGGGGTTTPAPPPAGTPAPVPAGFPARHQQFIQDVDGHGSCFKKEEMLVHGYTEQEFLEHSSVAIQDKYLAQSGDTFCSMKAVHGLVAALKRTISEQEIIQ